MHESSVAPAFCLRVPDARPLILLAGLLLLLTMMVLRPSPARAQGFYYSAPFWAQPQYYQRRYNRGRRYYDRRYYRRRYEPRREVRRPPAKAPKVDPKWYPDKSNKEPVTIVISLPKQKLAVYQGGEKIVTSRVSSGKKGHSTPTGVFSILSKRRWHRSNIYSGAPMPYMQRLTWSGIALHASGSVPSYPASHGCVRLPSSFASQLYWFTETGAHVVITNNTDLAPREIAHEKLFTSEFPPRKDYDRLESERFLADHGIEVEEKEREDDPIRILITRRTERKELMDVQRILNKLQFGAGDVDGVMGPETAQSIRRFQETYGDAHGLTVDGLVSEELIHALYKVAGKPEPRNGHIYIRQNFKQLFDAPITILDPDLPLGEHLITAQNFQRGDEVHWLYLSMNAKAKPRQEASAERNPRTATDQSELRSPVPVPVSTAGDALGRIVIPDALRQRIDEILTPGSSIAISDDGLSHETHPKGTDFVLLTKD